MICISWKLYIIFCQRSWIRRLTFCYNSYGHFCGLLGDGCPPRWVFSPPIAQPVWMRGSSRTYYGVKALLDRSTTQACNSLWRVVMRPTFLKSRAQAIENTHSQLWGRYGVSTLQQRKRTSLQPWSLSSFPFSVKGRTNSQASVFSPRHNHCISWAWRRPRYSASACSMLRSFCLHIFARPSRRSMAQLTVKDKHGPRELPPGGLWQHRSQSTATGAH